MFSFGRITRCRLRWDLHGARSPRAVLRGFRRRRCIRQVKEATAVFGPKAWYIPDRRMNGMKPVFFVSPRVSCFIFCRQSLILSSRFCFFPPLTCRLAGFSSHHGADFYGIPRNEGALTLVKEKWTVPACYPFGQTEVVPLRAGEEVFWQLNGEGKRPQVA